MTIHYVELNTTVVDGSAFTADDTIIIIAGSRAGLLLKNFNGNGRYIAITNEKTTSGAKVIINGKSGLGCLSISNCKYIDLRGDNDVNSVYGIKVINDGTFRSAGTVSISGESDHIKLNHLEITCEGNTTIWGYGIFIQDVDLTNLWTFDTFDFHHNYIHDTRNSAMYIGSDNPRINNKPYVGNFSIHDNLLEDLGTSGIVFKGVKGDNNYIYNNTIRRTGLVRTEWDDTLKSGIENKMFELGYMCKIYNNRIEHTVGTGIKCGGTNHLIHDNTLCGCGSGNNINWGHGIKLLENAENVQVNDNIIIQAKRYGIFADGSTNSVYASRNLIGDCGSGSITGTNIYEGTGIDANIYHADVADFGFKRWIDDGDCSNDDFSVIGTDNLEEIPQYKMNIIYVDSEHITSPNIQLPAINMIDGNPYTYWRTEGWTGDPPHPHEVQIDLGQIYSVSGFRYLPRQDISENGMIKDYEFYVSNDINDWGQPVSIGAFPLDKNEHEVLFTLKNGRYIRLVALSEFRLDGNVTSVAELNVLEYVDTDLCEGKVCPNVCVGTNLWSQKCNPETGLCAPYQLLESNSTTCGYDPCEGIVCPNVCIGDDLWSQKCVNGLCVADLLLESNSTTCGYDLCEGVVCQSICVGNDLWTQQCDPDTGDCIPHQLIQNDSELCIFDLCEGVVCPDVCIGDDLWSQRCDSDTGECVLYKLIEQDSINCIIPEQIPSDDSTIQTYLILGGFGIMGLAMLILNKNKK